MRIVSNGRARRRGMLALALAVVLAAAAVATALAAPSRHRAGAATPPYLDPSLPVAQRVSDLLGRMTLPEKVGQMTQVDVRKMQGDPANDFDRAPLNPDLMHEILAQDATGSILSGGGAAPVKNSPRAWADMTNAVQKYAIAHSRLHIPIVYGVDAVHGHNNVLGATMFPHQVGLGGTFDPALARTLGATTARSVRATGIQWDFAPVADTERDLRWGRSYEPFGEDPLLTGTMAANTIKGLQGDDLSSQAHVAATAKHFVGYSAPDSGHDRTDATISPAEMHDLHLPPFQQAIDAGVATVMINSGSVNGIPGHANKHLLTDWLRNTAHFRGLTVSDWQDVENLQTKYHVAATYEDAVALATNAGVDMAMVPMDATRHVAALEQAVADGKISRARIDQAVGHVLALKFRLGLFEHPYTNAERANAVVEDPAQRPLARRAAAESTVLLSNAHRTLPLSGSTGRVLVTGPSADNPINQLGGWSIDWQGADRPNEIPDVTTVREGVAQAAGAGTSVAYRAGVPADTSDNDAVAAARAGAVRAARQSDAVVAVVGEGPYAETPGDTETDALPAPQAKLIDALAATGKPVIVVVIAGRPLVMEHQLDEASAALMAFLPGTEGGRAVGDILFGKTNPSGRLSVSWPRSVDQLPLNYNHTPGEGYDPRYAFGHGLSYTDWRVGRLRAPRAVDPTGRVPVSVRLANAGRRGGTDSVLAFVERTDGPSTAPVRQLVRFDRETVGARDAKRVDLSFPVSQLAVTSPDGGSRHVLPGTYRLAVGDRVRTFVVR
jgi:beta-glucosidase